MRRTSAAVQRAHAWTWNGALVLILSLWGVGPANAVFGAPDVVPAATLLLPHFQVPLSGRRGSPTTTFSVRNVGGSLTLANATLWTDLGVPTLNFSLILAPYATRVVDLGDLFIDGKLPAGTGFGTVCETLDQDLSGDDLQGLQNAHLGQASSLFAGRCGGAAHRDNLARGFITIDAVGTCTDKTPVDEDYFGESGVAANDNVLWGEYVLGDDTKGFAQGVPMAHLEVGGLFARGITLDRTFYATLVGGTGMDGREALPTTAGTRYYNDLTDLVCWRDNFTVRPFVCNLLGQQRGLVVPQKGFNTIIFDDASGSETLKDPLAPCRLAATRVRVGSDDLPATSKTGWIFVDADPATNVLPKGLTTEPSQVHLISLHVLHPDGLSAGVEGVSLDDTPFGPAVPPELSTALKKSSRGQR